MAIYFTRVAAPAAFAAVTAPDITIPFEPKRIVLVNEDTTLANYIEFSFDGSTVHGRLIPTVLASIELSQRNGLSIWLRRGAGTPELQLTAEA